MSRPAPHVGSAAMSLPALLRYRGRFILPPSQRVYAWGEDQLSRLFHDSGFPLESGGSQQTVSSLFLGTVYLAEPVDGATAIADGQQRLVTITMIAAGLRDLTSDPTEQATLQSIVSTGDGNDEAQDRIRLREIDAQFFRQWVQAPGAMLRVFTLTGEEDGDQTALSESRTNIINNRNLVIERLRALGPAGRRQLVDFLEQRTAVVAIVLPTLAEALSAYASTYKRGLRQAETDRLKVEIFGDSDAASRLVLANHWDECEAALGKEGLETLCQLLVLNETGSTPMSDLQAELLERFDLPRSADAFVRDRLVPFSNAYRDLCEIASGKPSVLGSKFKDAARARRIRDHLVTLMRVTHAEWRAPAIVGIHLLRDDLSRLETLLAGLERLACVHMIAGVDPHISSLRYYQLSLAIRVGNWEDARAALDVSTELRSRCRDNLKAANFAQKSRYRVAVLLKANDLAAGEVVRILPAEVTCEHILPANVTKANPYWYDRFRTVDRRRYIGYLHRHKLGNVTLLIHVDNRKVGAREYPFKRSVFETSAYALTQVAARHAEWSIDTIERRTEEISVAICRHWNL